MKQISLLISGLLIGAILIISILLSANPAIAQDPSDSKEDVFDVVLIPLSGDTSIEESETVTITVPREGEGVQEIEPGVIRVTVTTDKSADLPPRAPEAMGVLLDQSANSYLVGSYSTQLVAGIRTCQPLEAGKESVILVTDSTRFFEDVTDFSQAKSIGGSSDLHVQQVILPLPQPGELPECASMLVWGEWYGDRLTADVILFHDES